MPDRLVDLFTAGIVTDPISVGLQHMIREEEPLIDRMAWVSIPKGKNAYEWYRENSLGTASWRAVNGGWDADHGSWVKKSEGLAILGGEIKLDTYIRDTMGGAIGDLKTQLFSAKMRAMKLEWLEALFEGDVGVDPNSMDGLRARIAGTTADFPMGGATNTDAIALTLEQIDETIDFILGDPTVMMGNQFLKRKINALIRSSGQAMEMVNTEFGKQLSSYRGVPFITIQREDTMSSILDFDEDPGDGGDDAASLYFARFGREHVFSILGHGGSWEVRDLGELQSDPQVLGRAQLYTNVVVKHPRSLARISRIGQL